MNPYLPLTAEDEAAMLEAIGAGSLSSLFSSIPVEVLQAFRWDDVPEGGLSEFELLQEATRLAALNWGGDRLTSFLGAGSYDHHIPEVVRTLTSRSEFATSYTPYQPEVSQGTLQAIFEFQSLICDLTALDVANASLYDGATAVAEAALLACAATRMPDVMVSKGLHPSYRSVLETYLHATGHRIIDMDVGPDGSTIPAQVGGVWAAAFIVGYPNHFGIVEPLERLRWSVAPKTMMIVVANPLALGLLEAPGALGADVVVGEAMHLGMPMSYGGPGLGFMAVKERFMRRVPGRLVGETTDGDGRRGFVLTLQAREQHIRRARASSNICTNQSLAALAATIHLCLLGATGMRDLARLNYRKAHHAWSRLTALEGVESAFTGPFFNEFAVRLPVPASGVVQRLIQEDSIVPGLDLGRQDPERENELLVAVTEKRSGAEIDRLVEGVERAISP